MTLHYPWILPLVIPLLILLWFFHFRRQGRKQILYPFSGKGLERLARSSKFSYVPLALRALALIFLFLALARPQTSSTHSKRTSEGIDIMIAFDVSKSMLIEDYNHVSRLDMAKEVIQEFVKKRSDDRIGFLMFAGESITLCPPTLDYDMLVAAIDAANVDQLKDGTAIGDALASSVNRIKEGPAKSKVIVLITDGDNNMGSIAPLTAGALAKGYGIKVYSVALGRDGVVDMPVIVSFFGQERKQYQRVNSTINPELLMKISELTEGRFFRAAEEGSLRKILGEIDKLVRNKVETKQKVRWEEHYRIPLWIAIAFLLIEFIASRTRFRVLPN